MGCITSKSELKADLIISNVFDDAEIRDLSKILTFFDEQICIVQQIDNSRIKDCYQAYFERMKKAAKTGNIEIKIPFEEQQKMYSNMDESTFRQIWYFGKNWRRNLPDTIKSIGLKCDGKYAEFLKIVGNENNVIKEYYESLKACGDISPTMVADLMMNYKNYDINDVKIRLIIAIHYLTMNDQYERKEKY